MNIFIYIFYNEDECTVRWQPFDETLTKAGIYILKNRTRELNSKFKNNAKLKFLFTIKTCILARPIFHTTPYFTIKLIRSSPQIVLLGWKKTRGSMKSFVFSDLPLQL